jgi:hypothetical protein
MPKVPSMKLGSLKHGQGNFFGIPSPILVPKIGGQDQKKRS